MVPDVQMVPTKLKVQKFPKVPNRYQIYSTHMSAFQSVLQGETHLSVENQVTILNSRQGWGMCHERKRLERLEDLLGVQPAAKRLKSRDDYNEPEEKSQRQLCKAYNHQTILLNFLRYIPPPPELTVDVTDSCSQYITIVLQFQQGYDRPLELQLGRADRLRVIKKLNTLQDWTKDLFLFHYAHEVHQWFQQQPFDSLFKPMLSKADDNVPSLREYLG